MSKLAACMLLAGLLAGTALAVTGPDKDQPKKLEARVDPRVELMSLIFRLAGNNEYNQPLSKSPYSKEVDDHFGKFRDHKAVKFAQQLRKEHGASFDAVMSLAVHLEDTKGLKLKLPLEPRPERLDQRWPPDETKTFLKRLRAFVKDTGFNEFYDEHRKLYDAAAGRLTEELNKRDYVGWFDKFFGERPGAKFYVVVGMLNGPCNYGSGIRFPDGKEEIIPVIGASKFDGDGIPVFGEGDVSTIAHEFCHSYTNVFVDQHADELKPAGEKIYETCASAMQRQAYGNWQTMFRESLVRACVVRYVRSTDGEEAAKKEIKDNHDRAFKWIGKLSDLLGEYESHRERYSTFDAFMPRVVEFFDGYVKEAKEQAGKAPKVIRMIPENGATDVDPELTEIKVFFDRPMLDKAWAVVGGGPNSPESAGKCHYEEGCKVFVLPVKLKPGWSYQFWLNRGQYNSFQSEDGVELESVEVNFKTRAK